MNLEEAKELLNKCTREELRDHTFGDAEIYWMLDGVEIADGYFGSSSASISIQYASSTTNFVQDDARALRSCGSTEILSRNDETGPDEYQEGVIMPGVTLEAVRKELTDECYDQQGNAHIHGRCDECGAPVGEDGCSTNTDHKV